MLACPALCSTNVFAATGHWLRKGQRIEVANNPILCGKDYEAHKNETVREGHVRAID